MPSAPGVFCIEADWFGLAHPMSMRPVLDLLAGSDARIPSVLRDAATRAEIEFYLRRWLQVRYRRFDLLWMAIHSRPGELLPGDMRRPEERISLDALEALLASKCRGRILHFSGCKFLRIPPARLTRFMRGTRALCVSGFANEVPWLEATIFEAYWLTLLNYESRTRTGVRTAARLMRREQGTLCRKYGFVMRVAP
ncbi:MAG: hypothetical protein EXS03_09385 [Phycisphaerales bacterium]|nr:hypothetical protein [Phycisphaerales bacterium]